MSAFAKEFSAGWREVVGAMIGIACGFTGFSPLQSFFFRALELDFGWSKTAAAISLIALPITALFLPVAGLLLDRFGVRRVALFSTLAFAACFILLSAMNGQLGMFYAAFIALSVLGIATGPISYTRAVATRFQASRGTALAIALLGSAIAGMILPQALA